MDPSLKMREYRPHRLVPCTCSKCQARRILLVLFGAMSGKHTPIPGMQIFYEYLWNE